MIFSVYVKGVLTCVSMKMIDPSNYICVLLTNEIANRKCSALCTIKLFYEKKTQIVKRRRLCV